MSEQRVTVDVRDHVAVVTLSRPDKHNALDGAMFTAIIEAAQQVAQAQAVRALLHAAGLSNVGSRRDLAGIERCSGGQWLELG